MEMILHMPAKWAIISNCKINHKNQKQYPFLNSKPLNSIQTIVIHCWDAHFPWNFSKTLGV